MFAQVTSIRKMIRELFFYYYFITLAISLNVENCTQAYSYPCKRQLYINILIKIGLVNFYV